MGVGEPIVLLVIGDAAAILIDLKHGFVLVRVIVVVVHQFIILVSIEECLLCP